MLECPKFDRKQRWAYTYKPLERAMTKQGVFDALVECMRANIPMNGREIPSSYISYNSTMHTFVDGDDRIYDKPNVHRGGNFGFLVSVPGTLVKCSYIADSSTIASGRRCRTSGEEYRSAYINAMQSHCQRKGRRDKLHELQRCCHANLTVMLDHHRDIRHRVSDQNRCIRGTADAMNQVQIVFGIGQIRAIFVRNNHIGFAQYWKPILPLAFEKATGRRAPLIEF